MAPPASAARDLTPGLDDRDEQGEEERRESGVEAEALWVAEEAAAEDAERGRADPARVEQEPGCTRIRRSMRPPPRCATAQDSSTISCDSKKRLEREPSKARRNRDADREVARVEQHRRDDCGGNAAAVVEHGCGGELRRARERGRGHDDRCQRADAGRRRKDPEGDAEARRRRCHRRDPLQAFPVATPQPSPGSDRARTRDPHTGRSAGSGARSSCPSPASRPETRRYFGRVHESRISRE